MVVIPLIALSAGGTHSPRKVGLGTTVVASEAAPPPAAAVAAANLTAAAIAQPPLTAPDTTVVTVPPVTSGPAPTMVFRAARTTAQTKTSRASSPAAKAPAPTTSTTAPAPRTTVARRPAHTQSGRASWYDAPKGTCAHPTLPFGTVVSITDTDNGRTASCTVSDRGPYAGGRIIDLSPDVFRQLAPTSEGVINVQLGW